MNGPGPRLRTDLIFSRQETAGGVVFVVKDPVGGGFFRFGELERFIAEQLDGETSLDIVRQRTEERFAASLPAEALHAFVRRLEKTGLLETQHGAKKTRRDRWRIRGSLLYLRFPLLDPDRLFTPLVRRVRFCFTPAFLVLGAALILLATGVVITHWGDVTQDLSRLYRLSAIPLVLVTSFVVGSAHEFAHGLTCKHFGGEVREMGFMLMYFQPALYTNVSDAWLFPEKNKRLWVSFAGPYFEVVLWALATLLWRVTEVDTWINYVALTVMAISGIKTLLNFNPLIKLDGYYLLSDYLGIPNLRKKSFAYVGGLIKRLVGLGAGEAGEAGGARGAGIAAGTSRRERRVYVGYGLVATVFSVFLLGYVFVKAGGFLIEIHQPAALALLTGIVGMRSRSRFRKLFGRSSDLLEPGENGDHAETPEPAASSAPVEPKDEPKKKKRKSRARRRRLVWAALAGATVAILVLGRMELRIGGSFTVLPEENADVRAEVQGIVEAIAVDEGDRVQAGDVIARLSNHALEVELPKTTAAIQETRAQLKKLETGATPEEIAVARAFVSSVEDRLRYARRNVARLSSLFETAAVTRQELEGAQELATTGENQLAEAKSRLEALLRRIRPEDIEAATARLKQLEAQQRFLERELEELTVRSPVTGIVATPSRQLKAMRGQLVSMGALIAKVYEFDTVTAQIAVSEKEIADVRVGQPVVLRVRAHPNEAFDGTVTAIATAAEGTSVGAAPTQVAAPSPGGGSPSQTFLVTTRIDNRSLLLKPGMTGHAKVMGGERRIVDLMTRRLARTLKVEVWSWW